MPWWLIVALVWGAISWIVALAIGRFFGITNDDAYAAPPAHPRARLVRTRDRTGHVEIKPTIRRGA